MKEIICDFCSEVLAEINEDVYEEYIEFIIKHEHMNKARREKLKPITLEWRDDIDSEFTFFTDAPTQILDKCIKSALSVGEDEVNELKLNLQKDGWLFIPLKDFAKKIKFELKDIL